MGLREFGDELQAVPRRCGRAQIEAGEHEAGRGEVHMAVDEGRRDEAAVEIDDLGVGELGQADVVAAQPDDGAIADGHRGGVRHGRTVDPAAREQRRQAQSGLGGNAGARRARCDMSPGRRCDIDDVDDFTVDVVAATGRGPGACARRGGGR